LAWRLESAIGEAMLTVFVPLEADVIEAVACPEALVVLEGWVRLPPDVWSVTLCPEIRFP